MERSLQQAKLQRQDKTLDDTEATTPTTSKHHSPDLTSRSSNTASPQHSGSSNTELKNLPGKSETAPTSKNPRKPAPIETDLDDPYIPDSDTVALISKVKDEVLPLQLAVEEETVILSSDEESTLLEK